MERFFKKNLRRITIILLLLIITSCGILVVPKRTRNNFTHCYDNKYKGLDTLINLNGFFYLKRTYSYEKSMLPQDTLYPSCIFYNNGFFVLDPTLKFLIQDSEYLKQQIKKAFGGLMGIYTINNDTIKAQFVEPLGGTSLNKGEIWFKIIDKNTIQELYFKYHEPIKTDVVRAYQQSKEDKSFYKFAPVKVMPNPYDFWLMNEKWFWCNEEDFENYK